MNPTQAGGTLGTVPRVYAIPPLRPSSSPPRHINGGQERRARIACLRSDAPLLGRFRSDTAGLHGAYSVCELDWQQPAARHDNPELRGHFDSARGLLEQGDGRWTWSGVDDRRTQRLPDPEIADRRKERPRFVPLQPEILGRRQEIANGLTSQIVPLSTSLRQMSDEERKAVFFKLEHEGTLTLILFPSALHFSPARRCNIQPAFTHSVQLPARVGHSWRGTYAPSVLPRRCEPWFAANAF